MNISKSIAKLATTVLLSSAFMVQTVQAEDFPSEPNWTITAYLWAQAIDGVVGIGPIEADIDLSFSDLLSALNLGGAIAFKRDWGRNVFVADLNYYSLSPDDVVGPLGGRVTTDLKQPLYQFYYGRKFALENSTVGWLVGARYMQLDTKLTRIPPDTNLPIPDRVRRADPDFTDFLIGGFFEKTLNEKWSLNMQGDFGVGGSDHSWNAQMFFQRHLKSGNAVVLGFRVTDVDFGEKLSSGEFFNYDARMTGLTVGFSWK